MEELDFEKFNGREWRRQAKWGFMQAKRGDMRPILLKVLEKKAMHGYEIIRHLEEQTHGMWRPSPGSVYPTLQLLEEEDLIKSSENAGKKIYELTKKGKKQATEATEGMPWAHHSHDDLKHLLPLRKTTGELIMSARHVVKQALKDKNYGVISQVATILEHAKKELEKLEQGGEE